jgi:hypothetical protein
MKARKLIRIEVIVVVCAALLYLVGCANSSHEHPAEHPQNDPGAKALTPDEMADAVEIYVANSSAESGGYFIVNDDQTGKQLKLVLDKVHRERVSRVGKDLYFVCADFKNIDGTVYDLDVFMRGPDKDSLTFSKFSVHKKNGKERYTWYEHKGIWKKKPVPEATKAEHPKAEHPKTETKAEHPKAETKVEHPTAEHPKVETKGPTNNKIAVSIVIMAIIFLLKPSQ